MWKRLENFCSLVPNCRHRWQPLICHNFSIKHKRHLQYPAALFIFLLSSSSLSSFHILPRSLFYILFNICFFSPSSSVLYDTAFNFLNISLTSSPLWIHVFLHTFLVMLLQLLSPRSPFFNFSLEPHPLCCSTEFLSHHMAQMYTILRSDHI